MLEERDVYEEIGGIRGLIRDYLRTECGHNGIVMTDWVMRIPNRGSRYGMPRSSRVAAAGGDLFMPGTKEDYEHILQAMEHGMLTRQQLETNAARVLACGAAAGARPE